MGCWGLLVCWWGGDWGENTERGTGAAYPRQEYASSAKKVQVAEANTLKRHDSADVFSTARRRQGDRVENRARTGSDTVQSRQDSEDSQ